MERQKARNTYIPASPLAALAVLTQARSSAARMRREAATTSAPSLAIQAAARRYLARRRLNRLVRDKQIEWEMSTMATGMGRFCAERARLRCAASDKAGV